MWRVNIKGISCDKPKKTMNKLYTNKASQLKILELFGACMWFYRTKSVEYHDKGQGVHLHFKFFNCTNSFTQTMLPLSQLNHQHETNVNT